MLTDLRFALRSLAKSPGFTTVALLTLALGIGAATAIFSVVHALILAPLPYRDASQLVLIQTEDNALGASSRSGLAPGTFADLAQDTRTLSHLAAERYYYLNLTHTTAPVQLTAVDATAGYFNLFGVPAQLGRTWRADECLSSAAPVVVLSDRLWKSQFGARADVIGKTIYLDDVAHAVVGVMPATFKDVFNNGQLWRPIPTDTPDLQTRNTRFWRVIARLVPGVTPDQNTAELHALASRYERDHPEANRGWTLVASDLGRVVIGDYRSGLLILLGAVGCVLLITCANVAGLTLVRATTRRKELAVRSALGASRGRLLRQLLAESLLLAVLGGALGILVGGWGLDALLASVPDGWLPRADEVALSRPVLVAACALTLFTGLAFGLVPGLTAARTNPNDALKDSNDRGTAAPAMRRLRSLLVIGEIAIALMLLVGAGVLGRSFLGLLQRNPGIQPEKLLTMTLSLSPKRYDTPAKSAAFYTHILESAAAVPGVQSAAFTQTTPFQWGIPQNFAPAGQAIESAKFPPAYYDSISTGYFTTTGIPLRAGRIFSAADDPHTPRVVIINETAAHRYFGAADPIGQHLVVPGNTSGFSPEIVGVVGDVRRDGLSNAAPLQVYTPLAQRPPAFATLFVRTIAAPSTVGASVQRAIWAIDAEQPISGLATMDTVVSQSVTPPRLYLSLFAVFAALALLLAALGLYGLVAYSVAQRTREFGIRVALGAAPRAVASLVLREAGALAAVGLGCGVVASLVAVRLLSGMLYDTAPRDPLVFAGVAGLLAVISLLAAWLPARRAMKVDPIIALRAE